MLEFEEQTIKVFDYECFSTSKLDAKASGTIKHATILSSSLDTIEACGGGSARCMMAEIFLPKV
jgi:hypothetical protein